MSVAPPKILPNWLKYLGVFALSNLVCALAVVTIAHAHFGEMRPLNGVFVGGAIGLALIALALFIGRATWIALRIRS